MAGHEYLTKIGILHRDISENNIVLGLRPGDERGYLIDLDMAILQNADEPTQPVATSVDPLTFLGCAAQTSFTASQSNHNKRVKALRTVRTLLTSCHC
jgi:serine/threonine protein kinase